MYSKANVSGPDEFGRLPTKDRNFWYSWLAERIDRNEDLAEELQKEIPDEG
jgi:hypothetical protein